MPTAQYPRRNQTYTLAQIFTLCLPDAPHLCFWHDNTWVPIQDSGATEEDMLSIPGFAESQWVYSYTTSEQIPVFKYHAVKPITDFVSIERNKRAIDIDDEWWATFHLFPQKQY